MVEELQLKMVFWLTEPFSSEERLRLPWRLLLIPLCCSWYSAHGSASLGPEPGNVCPQKSFYSEGPFLPVELHKSFQQQGQGWRPVLDIACKFQLCLFCVWLEEHYFTWVLDFLTWHEVSPLERWQFLSHPILVCNKDTEAQRSKWRTARSVIFQLILFNQSMPLCRLLWQTFPPNWMYDAQGREENFRGAFR